MLKLIEICDCYDSHDRLLLEDMEHGDETIALTVIAEGKSLDLCVRVSELVCNLPAALVEAIRKNRSEAL